MELQSVCLSGSVGPYLTLAMAQAGMRQPVCPNKSWWGNCLKLVWHPSLFSLFCLLLLVKQKYLTLSLKSAWNRSFIVTYIWVKLRLKQEKCILSIWNLLESLDRCSLLLQFYCPALVPIKKKLHQLGEEDYNGKKIITCMDKSFIKITAIFQKKNELSI